MPVEQASNVTSRVDPLPVQTDAQNLSKANEAIAIRPKRGRLTLLSRRIYNALLYHSQRQGVEVPVYRLPLAELIGDARFNSNNTELLKSHLREMQATTIEWSTSALGQRRWVSTQLIGTVSIDEPGRGQACTISWSYPEEVRERLVRPNQYTKLLLEMTSAMRSYAASVLYEIGARYLTSPGRISMREDIIWWAAVLTGRSEIDRVDYRYFKRDVLQKAIAEIDTLCDEFSLELIEHRRGRKVEELQFRVLQKQQTSFTNMQDSNRNVFDLALVGQLIALGIKQEEAQLLYASTDEGTLRATLELVMKRQRSNSLPEIKSMAAYLRDALKKGYAKKTDIARVEASKSPPIAPSREEQLQRIREAWENDRIARARAMYAEMPDAQKSEKRTVFEGTALRSLAPPIAKGWTRDGPESRLAGSSFFRWLAESTWPEMPTDSLLLDYALSKGMLNAAKP